MGYDLHIIRGEDWFEAVPIPSEEWIALVESLADFRMTGAIEATTPSGETLRYENPALAEWSGHSSGDAVPFDFRDGRVVVKNPDPATIGRMIDLAAMLGARVQDDEGEWYDEPPVPPRRSRWRRTRRR